MKIIFMKEKICHQRVVTERKFLYKQLQHYVGDVAMKYAQAQNSKKYSKNVLIKNCIIE